MLKFVIGKGIVSLVLSFLLTQYLTSSRSTVIDVIVTFFVLFLMSYSVSTLLLFEIRRRGIIVGTIFAIIAFLIASVVIIALPSLIPMPAIVLSILFLILLAIPFAMDIRKLMREQKENSENSY